MRKHVLQTKQWAEFKSLYGTPSVEAGGVFYTKTKIPFTSNYFAYAVRTNPLEIDFEVLKKSLEENECISLRLDVPNIIKGSPQEKEAVEILEKYCQKSPRAEFAKANVFLDISKSEEELLANMHYKHRYNIKYSQRNGVVVKFQNSPEGLDTFYDIYKATSARQGFFPRPKIYFEKLKEVFTRENMFHIATAFYEDKPLASWILFTYEDTLYYPYGGSLQENKNSHASCLLGWEAIRLGKREGCTLFDMWGAAVDPNDTKDSYYGFTNFKLKFGGTHVVYIDTYDLVVNQNMYNMFNMANSIRWKLLNILK